MAENLIDNVLLDKELLEKKVNFLEGMLNEDDKKKYDAYCKTICKYRNYFVIAHDRTGDGGMSMLYLGAFTNVEHAEKAAISGASPFIPIGRVRKVDYPTEEIGSDIDVQKGTYLESVYVDNGVVSTEYWAIMSREYKEDERYGVLIWSRDGLSKNVRNTFFVYDNKDDMLNFVKQAKRSELQDELESLNDSWFIDDLSGNYGLSPIDNFPGNLRVWGYEGYEVYIINGTFK